MHDNPDGCRPAQTAHHESIHCTSHRHFSPLSRCRCFLWISIFKLWNKPASFLFHDNQSSPEFKAVTDVLTCHLPPLATCSNPLINHEKVRFKVNPNTIKVHFLKKHEGRASARSCSDVSEG